MRSIIDGIIRLITRIFCKINEEEIDKIPYEGPLILFINHVNFLEAPIIITRLIDRKATGIAKEESWDNPLKAFLFNMWEGIPVKRGEADLKALKTSIRYLNSGGILAIAPEGTRSHDGVLAKAHAGITFIAIKSGAPMLPLATYGHENFWQNIKRLKRTPFQMKAGKPFRIIFDGKLTAELRSDITDEIMYQLAELLPEKYRGEYADLSKKTMNYLEYID